MVIASYGGGPGHAYGLVITVMVVVGILVLRNRRPRKLLVERLWLRPVFFVAIVLATLAAAPPPITALSVATMTLSVVIGAALGWQRGRFMRIDVDPETHALTSRASPVGMIFILAILALRIGLRDVVMQSRSAFGIPTAAITDGLILLLGAMIITQSLEMWLRARRLVAEAEAAKVGVVNSSGNPPIVR
jgi:hypothetical protein